VWWRNGLPDYDEVFGVVDMMDQFLDQLPGTVWQQLPAWQ